MADTENGLIQPNEEVLALAERAKEAHGLMLAGVRVFRFFLERTTDYEIEEIAIVAFFDWLQRGGSYRDPKMGEITKDEPR
jgi:hypothetical protein